MAQRVIETKQYLSHSDDESEISRYGVRQLADFPRCCPFIIFSIRNAWVQMKGFHRYELNLTSTTALVYRGAKPDRRYGLSDPISLLSPG